MLRRNHGTRENPGLGRRTFLLGAVAGIASTAGCPDALSGPSGPEDRSFDVTITAADGELTGVVAESDIEDVVQVRVGDTATFTFANETADPVGVHDHASDSEVVVTPGDERSISFQVTEAMIGRQEIEAWVADETAEEDGHGTDATAIVVVEVRPRGG